MVQVTLVMIVFGMVLLILAVSNEGLAWFRYCFGTVQCEAQVIDEVPFTLECSRGTVEEQQEDGSFRRLVETEDRNVGLPPFYHMLFERNKFQYVLQWQVSGKTYRGHYRFLKKRGTWKVGGSIPLRCYSGKPWKYAVRDESLWRIFLGKCLLDMVVLFAGILLLIYAV